MMLPKLVVFDMAGTTVEDRGEVPASFSAALAEQGIAVTPEQLNAVRGSSKRQAVLDLLPNTSDRIPRARRAYDSFKNHLTRRYSEEVRPIAGAVETFNWLRERGVRIALNTGFDREITDLLLSALGWKSDVVDEVVCGDEARQGRPAPYLIYHAMESTAITSVHDVAVAGDTMLDLQAGYNAGVRWNIGVLSGAHSREKLQDQPHTHLIPSVRELPSIWEAGADKLRHCTSHERDMDEEAFDWGTLKWLSNQRLSPGSAQTLGICQILPGRRNPLHYHPNCEEVLYMLAGEGQHSFDGAEFAVRAGSTVRIPAGVKHNLANTGADCITCLIAFSSGRRETVFLE